MSLSKLHTVFLALAIGQILFCMVTVYMVLGEGFRGVDFSRGGLLFPPAVILLVAAGTAYALNRLLIKRGKRLKYLVTKLQQYAISGIVRLAIVEGGNILILLLALLSGNLNLLIYFAVGMLVFLYFKPGLHDFASSFDLSEEEKAQLQQQY